MQVRDVSTVFVLRDLTKARCSQENKNGESHMQQRFYPAPQGFCVASPQKWVACSDIVIDALSLAWPKFRTSLLHKSRDRISSLSIAMYR
jgi:hypothetical protein